MTLDINYTTTNPRNVDKILESAIEEIQAGTPGVHKTWGAISA